MQSLPVQEGNGTGEGWCAKQFTGTLDARNDNTLARITPMIDERITKTIKKLWKFTHAFFLGPVPVEWCWFLAPRHCGRIADI